MGLGYLGRVVNRSGRAAPAGHDGALRLKVQGNRDGRRGGAGTKQETAQKRQNYNPKNEATKDTIGHLFLAFGSK
jgi:hypothetical protein